MNILKEIWSSFLNIYGHVLTIIGLLLGGASFVFIKPSFYFDGRSVVIVFILTCMISILALCTLINLSFNLTKVIMDLPTVKKSISAPPSYEHAVGILIASPSPLFDVGNKITILKSIDGVDQIMGQGIVCKIQKDKSIQVLVESFIHEANNKDTPEMFHSNSIPNINNIKISPFVQSDFIATQNKHNEIRTEKDLKAKSIPKIKITTKENTSDIEGFDPESESQESDSLESSSSDNATSFLKAIWRNVPDWELVDNLFKELPKNEDSIFFEVLYYSARFNKGRDSNPNDLLSLKSKIMNVNTSLMFINQLIEIGLEQDAMDYINESVSRFRNDDLAKIQVKLAKFLVKKSNSEWSSVVRPKDQATCC